MDLKYLKYLCVWFVGHIRVNTWNQPMNMERNKFEVFLYEVFELFVGWLVRQIQMNGWNKQCQSISAQMFLLFLFLNFLLSGYLIIWSSNVEKLFLEFNPTLTSVMNNLINLAFSLAFPRLLEVGQISDIRCNLLLFWFIAANKISGDWGNISQCW